MNATPGFTLVHLDDYLAVVDKQAGLLTVPAYGDPCLVDLLEAQLDRQCFGRHRLAVVHRLDRQTSGLLVFARAPQIAAHLAKQFACHTTEREYLAVVGGCLNKDSDTLSSPVLGKRAVTNYRTVSTANNTTTVTIRLETGRRNQIRRHFAEIGHPVLGDTRFEPAAAAHHLWPHTRLALHARTLGFVHPVTKQTVRFEAALPDPFAQFTCINR